MAWTNKQVDEMKALFQSADVEDLDTVAEMYQLRRTWLSNQARRQLVVGQEVTFNNNGSSLKGVIKKINPKTVVVAVNRGGYNQNWKVSATHLKKLVA